MEFALRAALTVAFVASGGYCLLRCVGTGTQRGARLRVNDAVHVVMAVEMIVMVWAPAVPDPAGIRLAVFALAAGWFLVQATGVPLGRSALVPAAPGPACAAHPRPGRLLCAHHALLLGVMVWMLVADRTDAPMAGMVMHRHALASVTGAIGGYCLIAAVVWAAVTWWPGRPFVLGGAAAAVLPSTTPEAGAPATSVARATLPPALAAAVGRDAAVAPAGGRGIAATPAVGRGAAAAQIAMTGAMGVLLLALI